MAFMSLDLLKTIRSNLDTDDREEGALCKHLQAAETTFQCPMRPFRKLDDFIPASKQLPSYMYMATSRKTQILSSVNCHNGQRKLTFSLLEFIYTSLCSLRCSDRDVVIVYAGASGLAAAVAMAVFPDLQMLLYDPMPNLLSMMPPGPDRLSRSVYRNTSMPARNDFDVRNRLHVFTSHAGWFTDQTALHIRHELFPLTKRHHILFVSDVRAKTGEHFIAMDMVNQQRWAVKLGADAYMFKFRIPYPETAEDASSLTSTYEGACAQLISRGLVTASPRVLHTSTTPSIPYLDGDLYVQLYGRPRTAELRLIGMKKNSKYAMRRYNLPEIEDKMAVFNYVYRTHAAYKWDENAMPVTYESASEYLIVCGCASVLKSSSVAHLRALIEYTISMVVVDRDGITCSLLTAIKDIGNRPRQDIINYVWSCYNKLKDRIASPAVRDRIETKLLSACRQCTLHTYPHETPTDFICSV